MSDICISHNELAIKGAKWLSKHDSNIIVPNCSEVALELSTPTNTGEIPDVIGWCYWTSVLLEIKVSRADFLKDFKKPFRKNQNLGVGELRYYLVPEGLINQKELPTNWGLLYLTKGNKIEIVKKAKPIDANLQAERSILLSLMRRKKD